MPDQTENGASRIDRLEAIVENLVEVSAQDREDRIKDREQNDLWLKALTQGLIDRKHFEDRLRVHLGMAESTEEYDAHPRPDETD